MLSEWLKRPIFSDDQAKIDQVGKKVSSQTSNERHQENSFVSYDPFSQYVNQAIGGTNQAIIKASEINAQILRWREISYYPEVDEAIMEISNEAIVHDEIEGPVELNLTHLEMPDTIKEKIVDSFQKILYMLNFNEQGDELFRQWYVDGQLNVEVVFNNNQPKQGIQKLILLTPFNFFKIKNPKDGKTYFFYAHNPSYKKNEDFEKSKDVFKEDQIIRLVSGAWSIDRKIPLSYLQKALKSINQLYLLEDAMVIYRITRAPEKRVFYIDTGRLPKSKAEEYVKSLILKYRQKKVYDVQQGDLKNKPRAISILEDFWFPTSSDGRGTKVDTLQGVATNFSEMEDVNYFLRKVYKSLNIPQSRRFEDGGSQGSSGGNVSFGNNLEVERSEIKFFKYILKLRKRFSQLFLELLKRDIIAQRIITLEEWSVIKEKIFFKYINANEISLMRKLNNIQIKMEIAAAADGLREPGILSRAYIHKEIMQFTDEEIKEIKEQRVKEKKEDDQFDDGDDDDGGGFGGGPAPQPVVVVDPEKDKEPPPKKEKDKEPPKKEKAKEESVPANQTILAESMLNSLKDGKIVQVGDKLYKLEGNEIIEVEE